jgi:hypothetical protein
MGAILNDPFKIIYRESLGAYCFEASTLSLQLDGPTGGGSPTVVGYWVVDKEKFLS